MILHIYFEWNITLKDNKLNPSFQNTKVNAEASERGTIATNKFNRPRNTSSETIRQVLNKPTVQADYINH